jgi:hypothetical protein
MEVKGILLAFPNIAPEYTEAYNRWYDLDHLAEHISKPDVLTARRYVAPRDLREAPGVLVGEATAGYQPYATVYMFGVDDFTGEEALAGWRTKDRGLIKGGRFWRAGSVPASGRWRLAQTFRRPSLHVSDEAVPYLAHRGLIVAIGQPPAPDQKDDAIRWWTDTHLPDLLTLPGLLAALRFDPADDSNTGRLLHLLLLEDDPAAVMPRIIHALHYSQAVGRYPAHGGVYQPLTFLPYRSITPLDYNFTW